ncbi:MAG: FKBP-type peptidyl-prolyl cis-trans isomerase [Lachnospiraceae bacterium]|nr:FKBP-type peptidyl-prolyl cis-trans isomerase [Lachnospiraceae bacterium]
MRLAVAYDDNGGVFQHFGRTEAFKIYEIEDGSVLAQEVRYTDGVGHEAIAGLLKDWGIDALLVGGMGEGAKNALEEAGVTTFSGVTGSADDAVRAFLRGEITSEGVNCDHHDEEAEESGCGEGCGSEGGCAGCPGCGGEPQIIFEGRNAGKTVRVHYRGTLDDGTQFDSSYERNEPLEFISGVGMMIEGFDKAVVNMEAGQTADVHLAPSEAYGETDPEAVFTVKIADLPGSENVEVGQQVMLYDPYGRPVRVKVTDKTDTDVTFDANHELAGKALSFRIELLEVLE